MDLYPAIDLLGGRCVRLYQGDYDRVTDYGDDPVAQARAFESAGARWIHVVDLDAAREGTPVNRAVIARIAAAVGVPVQTGGECATSARPRRCSSWVWPGWSWAPQRSRIPRWCNAWPHACPWRSASTHVAGTWRYAVGVRGPGWTCWRWCGGSTTQAWRRWW
ncbi:MAG: HisA/HisF-related TIM barrel protein [Microthrixaceae bacterium]|nr:HisA/HisF-related TIM barrel protein [Microthrixaceae bacterium]